MAQKLSLPTLYKFYRPLVATAVADLGKIKSNWGKVASVTVATILFLFNKNIAGYISAVVQWHGFSKWWAAVPASILFVYYLLRAIYQKFEKRESEANKAIEEERQKVKAAEDQFNCHGEWKELAARFEKLPNYIRADWQCNRLNNVTIYERWGLSEEQAAAICRYAGTLLMKSPNAVQQLSEKVKEQSDPVWRWLFFLKEYRSACFSSLNGYGVGDDGVIYFLGSIVNVSVVSASVCLDLATVEL